jgi:predicted site-specific integrase-resolvase
MQMTPVLFTPLFDARRAAAALDVSRATIVRWVANGYMHAADVINGAYVFTADEVERVAALPRPRRGRPPKRAAA